MRDITLHINGADHPLQIEDNWTLLYVLREVLNLTGTKYGCGTNDCGACKVLVDGVPRNSCVLPASRGSAITVSSTPSSRPSWTPEPSSAATAPQVWL